MKETAIALGVSRMGHTEISEVGPRRKRNRRYKGKKDLSERRESRGGEDGGKDRCGQDPL